MGYKSLMEYATYLDLLHDEFEKRKSLNGAYSLRAFARDLGMSAPRLSQVLNQKHGLSIDAAKLIATKLRLSPEVRLWFCDSVGAMHARGFTQRSNFKEKIKQYKHEAKTYSELQMEYFKVISDWYHFAILELTYHKDFKNDIVWISRVLEISEAEAEQAIERMKSLELIREEDNRLVDVFKFLATPSDVPSASIKKFNTQMMKKALEAVYEQDVLNREISSNVFSINKEQLPEFKEHIRSFRRKLEVQASATKERNAVYCLGIQFFELTTGDEL